MAQWHQDGPDVQGHPGDPESTEDPTRPYGDAGDPWGEETEVDPSLPLFAGAEVQPLSGTATTVDSPPQVVDGAAVQESAGEDPLSPLATEVEEPTDLERGVPFGLDGAEPGDDER